MDVFRLDREDGVTESIYMSEGTLEMMGEALKGTLSPSALAKIREPDMNNAQYRELLEEFGALDRNIATQIKVHEEKTEKAVGEIAEKLRTHTLPFDKLSYSNKHIYAIIFSLMTIATSIIGGVLFINNTISGMRDEMHISAGKLRDEMHISAGKLRDEMHQQNGQIDNRINVLQKTIEERFPPRPIAFTAPPIPTDSHSSTPPTATGGSPTP